MSDTVVLPFFAKLSVILISSKVAFCNLSWLFLVVFCNLSLATLVLLVLNLLVANPFATVPSLPKVPFDDFVLVLSPACSRTCCPVYPPRIPPPDGLSTAEYFLLPLSLVTVLPLFLASLGKSKSYTNTLGINLPLTSLPVNLVYSKKLTLFLVK